MNELQTVTQYCPYCGEPIELVIDCSTPSQNYIEDCQVCCRPINFYVSVSAEGDVDVIVSNENE